MQNGQDDATQAPDQEQQEEPQIVLSDERADSEQQPTSEQDSRSDDADDDADDDTGDDADDDADTFPRSYVERLRSKAADYRTKAKDRAAERDTLRGEVWALRVEASGRLADPTDLPLPDDTDTDADTVEAAIDQLLERKPHLAARRAGGDIGQHTRRSDDTGDSVNLADMLARGA